MSLLIQVNLTHNKGFVRLFDLNFSRLLCNKRIIIIILISSSQLVMSLEKSENSNNVKIK